MSDTKYVDPLILAIAVDYGIDKALREYDEFFDKFPGVDKDTPKAIKIERDPGRKELERLAKQFKVDIINFYGELPAVDDDDLYNPTNPPKPDEPTEEMYGMKYKTVVKRSGSMMNDGTTQAKYILPGKTGAMGEKLILKWEDGLILYVKDSHRMTMNPAPDKRKYRPCDGDVAECYAKVGTAPKYVTVYHNKSIGSGTEPEPVESDWQKIEWGGQPNDPNHDRQWWTKIHGSSSVEWSRKFPLPDWVDDESHAIDFRFSDGSTLHVPDSTEMAMNSNGPKYRPEEHGESDPKKQHPKIGGVMGASPTWVEYRVRKKDIVDPGNPSTAPTLKFVFKMTHQKNAECGFLFDMLALTIDSNNTTKTYSQNESMIVKQSPHRVGQFTANLQALPAGDSVVKATMLMKLNKAEGIANDDDEGVVEVTDGKGNFVRKITAKDDIKGKGYHKYNPNVMIDFTDYVRKLYGG